VARYEVVGRIATGGMAEILLARAKDGTLVVQKRILPRLVGDAELVRMFLDEARLAKSLAHANIVRVLDVGEDAGDPYLVMERLEGADVARIVAAGRPIPLELALHIASSACTGLDYAHERGIVHRDVSPHNLFVTDAGEVKVLDFGIAKAADRLAATRHGTIKGKLSYMSPEQAQSLPVDRRSDVFSVGVVLWELLSGRRLYDAASDFEILRAIVDRDAPPLAGVPAELDRIVRQALARDPAQRPATAAALAAQLKPFAAGASPEFAARFLRELPLPPEETAEAGTRALGPRPRKRASPVGPIIVALGAAIVAATALTARRTPAAAGVERCGTIALLDENYSGPEYSESFSDPGTQRMAKDGVVTILPAPNREGRAFAGYATTYWLDLRGGRVAVEVLEVPRKGGANLVAAGDSQNYVGFEAADGLLYSFHRLGGLHTEVDKIPYDAKQHRFWQVREAGGTVYWETSPDGKQFTTRAKRPAPEFMRSVEIEVMGGTYGAEPDPGRARFAHLVGESPGSPLHYCPAASLQDAFDDGTRHPRWNTSYAHGPCTLTQGGGSVQISLSPGESECAYQSASAYELRESAFAVEVSGATGGSAFLRAVAGDGDVAIVLDQGTLHLRARSADVAALPFDAAAHRFWRLREHAGAMFWETSPDGRDWVTRAHAPDPIDPSAVKARFGAAGTAAGEVRFGPFGLTRPTLHRAF
jgi:tRNA A-37 threonylcarbamoyl transferase component Bud32